MQVANHVVSNHAQIKIQEVPKYMKLYHGYLKDMRDILTAEIDSDKKCFKHIEEDAEENKAHYLNLLINWQRQIREWEQEWKAASPTAHLTLAAVTDVHGFVLGSNGLVAHLDEINFDYNEDDAKLVADAVFAE